MPAAAFTYTGGQQTFVVPAGVTSLTVDLYGAQGGDSSALNNRRGGYGGRCQGVIAVTPGETIYVYVGGKPANNAVAGGYNGGGDTEFGQAGPGGGATDIRRGGTALANRVAVAGAGAGCGNANGLIGGYGGGLTGGQNFQGQPSAGTGGTQSAGGQFGGGLGVGGSGVQGNGGGGGGYYGGGAIQSGSPYNGGGGSSLVPAGGSTTQDVRAGHGYAVLTYDRPPNSPTSIAPAQGAATGTSGTIAVSAVVSDPDGDSCFAEWYWSSSGGGGPWNGPYTGTTVASGGTSTGALTGVPANATITLHTRAYANGLATGPVETTFLTNRPPAAPVVTAPNGGEVYNTFHTVSWTGATDPDGQAVTYDVDLTTNGGATWTSLKTAFSGTSFTHDFTNVAASTACRIRVRTRDTQGSVSAWDESNANFTIQHNQAPTAPILGAPANGSTQDLAAGYTFTYTATDPDSGDLPSAWAFRRKITGAGAYEYWNAGTGAWQAGIVWNTNPTGSVAFASAKWTNGNTYNWSVATKDTQGVEGPFAADASVTASSVATTTATAPSGSVTTTSRPLVTWTLTQPEGQPQQTYQVRVFSAAQYGAVGFDPGTSAAAWETSEITSAGAREHQVGADLVNGTAYRAYVRLKSANLFTAWAFSAFTMALTPPPPVTLVVTDEPVSPFGPRVRLDVDLAYSAPFAQANTTISVERSDDGGATWTLVRGGERMALTVDGSAVALDYEPPRGVPVQYRALSVGDV